MLNAQFQVVDYRGRTAERAELTDWRESGPRLSAVWLHGPGGQGKTRLAAEFAAESATAGWKVITAVHDGIMRPQGTQDLRADSAKGVLLIVDYADRRPLSHLTWLFSNALLHGPRPTRLVLLARSAVPWPAVRAVLEGHLAGTRDLELTAPATVGERKAMFGTARDCFAAVYGIECSGIAPPDGLEMPEFGLVLALHMAALVAVDTHARGVRSPREMDGITSYLLGRERIHWTSLWENRLEGVNHQTPPGIMGQAVFAAALTGAVNHEDGIAALDRIGLEAPASVLADHGVCYPPQSPGDVLEPLYPDRLAEDFLALSLPGHSISGSPAASWAPKTVRKLGSRSPHGRVPVRSLVFLASAGASNRWPHVAPFVEHLIQADPSLAVAAGSPVLSLLAELDIDDGVLERVAAELPRHGDVNVDVGAATLIERLTPSRVGADRDPAVRSGQYQELAFRLSRAGREREATDAAERAVECARSADDDSSLAIALVYLSEYADRAEQGLRSRAAAKEATELFRGLAAAAPADYEVGLALSLSNRAMSESRVVLTADALADAEQAVRIFARLAQKDPTAYSSGFAMAITSLAGFYQRVLQPAKSLRGAEKAVGLLRERLAAGPATAESDFARSLAADESNLAWSLAVLAESRWGARCKEQSIEALDEALEISRKLAEAIPEAYETDLARIAERLAIYLWNLDRPRDAFAVAQEATAIFTKLAAADPGRHEEELAGAFVVYVRAGVDGRCDLTGPQQAAEQALAIYQRLNLAHPGAHRKNVETARDLVFEVREAARGFPPERRQSWTYEAHWSTLINQDEEWQDASDRRLRIAEMDPKYCANVRSFILRQADDLLAEVLAAFSVTPEALGLREGDTARSWLESRPLLIALKNRAALARR
ncbi:P-loop NTPase family protein [Actinoallomurus bryophytorum]|nr:ATP-binding protein [Actinoallomurus bryophytorum]